MTEENEKYRLYIETIIILRCAKCGKSYNVSDDVGLNKHIENSKKYIEELKKLEYLVGRDVNIFFYKENNEFSNQVFEDYSEKINEIPYIVKVTAVNFYCYEGVFLSFERHIPSFTLKTPYNDEPFFEITWENDLPLEAFGLKDFEIRIQIEGSDFEKKEFQYFLQQIAEKR